MKLPMKLKFQISLFSCIVLSFVAGYLLWLNVRNTHSKDKIQYTLNGIMTISDDYTEYYYGWPYVVVKEYHDQKESPVIIYDLSKAAFNSIVGLIILLGVAIVIELVVVRRVTAQPAVTQNSVMSDPSKSFDSSGTAADGKD